MRIVHVGYAHRPDDIRIFQKECLSLAKFGHQVFYITSDLNCKSVEVPDGSVQTIVVNLRKSDRRFPYVHYWKDLKRILLSLDADIYHFHELPILPVLLYMKKKGKKVIYDLHEDTPRQMQPSMYRRRGKVIGGLIIGFFEAFENYCIKKADYIITATPHIAERCKKLTGNVECIANYPIVYSDRKAEKWFEEREKIICYTGGISESNGIFNIVKAMQDVDGVLYLAGNLSKELKDRLIEYDGWKKVRELGYVAREEVQKILSKSIAGLVLYLPEGNTIEALPNKLFEYMEAGLPVISSDFPLWKEIVEGNQCGICVDPNKPEEIASAINRVLKNPKWAKEMGGNGRRLVQEKYNWGGAARD